MNRERVESQFNTNLLKVVYFAQYLYLGHMISATLIFYIGNCIELSHP